jgi:hypothetical protein
MARKKTPPTPIDPAELETELSRAIAADPEAGRQLQEILSADDGSARGEAMVMPDFLGRFLQVYDVLDKLGVIEWIRKRRSGSA